MPYITQERRNQLVDDKSNKIIVELDLPFCGGDLQYIIAVLMHNYLISKGLNYQHCQDIMGALAGAQAEFYRIVVAPYEDSKIKENGSVYSTKRVNDGHGGVYVTPDYPKPGKY